MNRTKVSVIIPVYNAEKHLRQCLDSVIKQTLRDIEIICVDDGSTDASLDILREFESSDGRIKVLPQNNQYAGVARNHGIAIANGKYYAFLDSDDYYTINALEVLYNISEEYNTDFVKASFYNVDLSKSPYDNAYSINGWVNKDRFHKILSFPDDIKDMVHIADVPWNGLYKAEFIQNNNIAFNDFKVMNDHSFFIECLIHAKRSMVIENHVVYHRINQRSSLVGQKYKYYRYQIENYYLVKSIVEPFPLLQKRPIMQREIDGVLHWYKLTYNDAEPETKKQMECQLRSFISSYDENDAGIRHLLNMHYKDFYYKLKAEVKGEQNSYYPISVSIIIPVYNTETYIDECLSSICSQTFEDIEIICIDDKSTDNSLEVLKKWALKDPRVNIISHSKNNHQGGARNTGLDVARGKYVWFIDSDDYIDNDAVECLVTKMESLHNVDLILFNADSFIDYKGEKKKTETGNIIRQWPKNRKIYLQKQYYKIPAKLDGTCITYFAKRTLIDNYRFRSYVYYEDVDFTFDILTSSGVFYEIDYSPYHRRIRSDSATNALSGINEKCIKGRLLAIEEIFKLIKKKNLSCDHFGVIWAVDWFNYSSEIYFSHPEFQNEECDQLIGNLQSELRSLSGNLQNQFFVQTLKRSVYELFRPVYLKFRGAIFFSREYGLKRTWQRILSELHFRNK